MLSANERARYSRHLSLPGFGLGGQEKLKAASVLVIGAGGLGCPLLQYLAAAGIGTIGIVDHDLVNLSNLQRQVLFGVPEIGRNKAEVAKEKLSALNPEIRINLYPFKLDSSNATDLFNSYDIIADCTDNFPTRYLVNDAAVLAGKPYIYGSIFRFEGQLAVFNDNTADGRRGPNYRDLYPDPPAPGEVPDCAEGGVLGVLPGIIGTMQALEIIKLIAAPASIESGILHIFDAASMQLRSMRFRARPDNPLTGDHPTTHALQNYELFCGIDQAPGSNIKNISPEAFTKLRASGEEFQLIDVRNPHEYNAANIGGINIPLSSITENLALISRDLPVIIHCQSGQRSIQAIRILQSEFQFDNLLNLEGGLNNLNLSS